MEAADSFYEGEYVIYFLSSWEYALSEKIWIGVSDVIDKQLVIIHVPLLSETCKLYDHNSLPRPGLKCLDDKEVASRLINRYHILQLPCSVIVNSSGEAKSVTYFNALKLDTDIGEHAIDNGIFQEAVDAFYNFDLHKAATKCVIYYFFRCK